MDDRYFDTLTRRLGELTAPAVPRRGLLRFFGAGVLAGVFGLAAEEEGADARRKRKRRDRDRDRKKRCKKPGKRCNRRKCKKRGKRCCCEGKCRKNRCEDKGGRCDITVHRKNVWGDFGSGNGEFRSPWGIATDEDGNVYVTDTGNDRVQIFSASGSYRDHWGQSGTNDEILLEPLGIGVNQQSSGDTSRRVFVTDPAQDSESRLLRQFRTDGRHTGNLGGHGLASPRGIAIDDDNNAWVVDRSLGRIYLYDRGGNYITHWEPGGSGALNGPEGIAVYQDGNDRTYVYVTDTISSRLHMYRYTGNGANGLTHVKRVGSQGGGRGNFNQPTGLSADACGNLWVADRVNERIQILDRNLKFISRFTAGFNRPTDTAISPNGKFLYVVDSNNVRIQRFRLKDD